MTWSDGHHCDRDCICPECGRPMLYSSRRRVHGCPDPVCANAFTIVLRNVAHKVL